VHLLVDSTGLKLCGPGEWRIEKHGTKTRRSWKMLHNGQATPRFTRYGDTDFYEEHDVKPSWARGPQEPVRARIGRH